MREHVQQAQAVHPHPVDDHHNVVETVVSPQMLETRDRVKSASPEAISTVKIPGFRDEFQREVTPAPEVSDRVNAAAENANIVSPQKPDNVFTLSSNPAKAILDIGLEVERRKTQRFAELRNDIQQAKIKADHLLKVQSECQKLSPDKKSHPLSPELKGALDDLRLKGIDLVTADKQELTMDELIALRSTVSSHLETLRTMEMQLPFMEAEKLSSEMQSMIQALRKILDAVDRLISKAQSKVGR